MRGLCLAVLLAFGLSGAARAQVPVQPGTAQGMLCRSAVAAAERSNGIPSSLLAAISRVESGRRDPATGALHPWPWTANVEGQGYYFESKAEAVATIRAMQGRGIRSIDVGCGQINLLHHPNAFPNLEAAFDPQTNAAYAGRFLRELFAQTGDWNKATGMYHSATPELAEPYQRQVLAVWPEEQRLAGLVGALPAPSTPAWGGGMLAAGSAMPHISRLQPAGATPGPRMIMLPNLGGDTPPGRGLDAYRAAPIGLAYQPPTRRFGG